MAMPALPDALSAACRAVSFVLLLNAAGIAIFLAIFGRLLAGTLRALHRLGWVLALAAMALVASHQSLEAARMAGEMDGALDPSMQMLALHSSTGAAFALRMLGLALVALGLATRTRWLGVAGALLAISGFALTGHASVGPYHLVSGALLLIHLLVVAFWLGALWPLYVAAAGEPPANAARLIDAFSNVAVWVVPCILLAGIGLTVLLVPSVAVFSQPYGQLLLAKVALFAVLMAFAALNKWTFGAAVGRGDGAATTAFRRTVSIEYVLISAALAVTAVMTTFYSPEVA
jgi:putative copper export protein